MNGEFIIKLCKIELLVILFLFILSFYEFLAILLARIKKLTKNISRIITHFIICVILIIISINSVIWLKYIEKFNIMKIQKPIFVNWSFLVILILIGFLFIYEFIGIYNARRYKLTKNISRLITHFVMLILFFILIYCSVIKWNIYIEMLKQPIVYHNK